MNQDRLNHITDNELLSRFYESGNNEWLGILLKRYTLLLLGVCMKYLKNEEEAKDAVQQVFIKALTELPKYKVEYIKSWLYMIAKNHCLMKLRDQRHTASIDATQHLSSDDEWQDKKNHLEKDELLNLLEESIGYLNNEQQQCVKLFYLEKKSYQEITDITGFSLLQVKSYIQNGKRNLKIMVEKKMNKY